VEREEFTFTKYIPVTERGGRLGKPRPVGMCDFSEVPFGNLTVKASHPRYRDGEQSISLHFGEQQSVQFALQLRPGNIEGTVTVAIDGLGQKPKAGIQVTLGERTTKTDENGFYRFASVVPGTYTLTAILFGLFCMPVSKTITVRGGSDTERLDFTLNCFSSFFWTGRLS
jgi:hypothetical protein